MDRRRLDVRLLIASLAVAAALSWAGSAVAQSPPRVPPREITSSNGPFTDEQRAVVKAHGEYWAARLADAKATPDAVEEARAKLLAPLEKLNDPTPYFRFEYAGFVVPLLEPTLKTGSLHSAINAARVLGELGSPRAVSVLIDVSATMGNPDRWQVRQRAADGVRNNLQMGILDWRTVNEAVRRLADSCRNETNNHILRYKFDAIAVASEQANLQPAEREQLREKLVDTIVVTVDRIAADNLQPSPILEAVYAAVVRVRNAFIGGGMSVAEQKKIGEKLGPALGKVLVIANTHWQSAQAEERTAKLYGNFVQVCEEFLRRIDGYVRGPDQSPKTQLQSAWTGKQKDQFDTGSKQWNEVLSKPPYKSVAGN
jgi:hypothetical protein